MEGHYEKGIHMFGSGSAFNLNSSLYDWNNKAKSVYVYYKTDSSKPSTSASTFSGGTVALTGGAGLAIGVFAAVLGIKATDKKKKPKT